MLPDKDKTKEQLVSELASLHQRIAELEASEAERRQAEEALKESHGFIEKVADSLPDVIYIYDLFREENVYASKSLNNVLGYTPEEFKAMGDTVLGRLFHPDDLEPFMAYLEKLKKVKGSEVYEYEYRMKHKDGHWIWIQNRDMIFTRDSKGKPLQTIGTAADITERKQVEQALQESEENFRRSLEDSPLGVRIFDAEGGTLYANRAILDIYGYASIEEFKTTPVEKRLTPESYTEHVIRRERRLWGKGISKQFETSIVRKDGEIRHLQVFRKEVLWNGKQRVQSIYQDITERKEAEEREEQLQQELRISSRLAAVGELAAGVAHEINNPLTGVLGFSERLLRKSTDEGISRDLERIHNEAQRIVKVMDNLRTFTHRREPEKQYSDINNILHETLELRAYELRTGNIEVVTDFAPSLPEIEVDSHQIQEVFLNIILNAEQVMTEARTGGKLTIRTRKIKNYVRISFADDGPGIPAEHLDKLFDPFFTTREEQGGTGLGLSVCHGIVRQHGGRLYARSKPGQGATFFVELPCP